MESRSWVVITNSNKVSPITAKIFDKQALGSGIKAEGKPPDVSLKRKSPARDKVSNN